MLSGFFSHSKEHSSCDNLAKIHFDYPPNDEHLYDAPLWFGIRDPEPTIAQGRGDVYHHSGSNPKTDTVVDIISAFLVLGCHAASDISDHDPGMACDQMISGDFIPSRKQISVDSGNNTSMFWHERLLVAAPSGAISAENRG